MSDDTDSQEIIEPKYPIVTIEDEMRDSYLEYAMSVIVGRALPDVRDGLKPVHLTSGKALPTMTLIAYSK